MTRVRDAEATKKAILSAAEATFLSQGYGGASLSEIARRAGVTKSLIHHHFGSKGDLWHQVKLHRFSEYSGQQMRMLQEGRPTPELLRDSVEAYFRFLQRSPEMVRMLAWIYLELDEGDERHLGDELTELGIQRLRQGQEAGVLRNDVDARSVLFCFLGQIQSWFQNHRVHEQFYRSQGITEEQMDESFLQDMLKIFMEGLLPR